MTQELTCYYENSDEPSCPKCGHYNAMLRGVEGDYELERFFRKCRDCGAVAVVVENPNKKEERKP